MKREIKNAVIESANLDYGDKGLLTAWIHLDYGGSGQGFGGYALYLPDSFKHGGFDKGKPFAGHFITRCIQIAGVSKWDQLKGKTVRVDCEHSKVYGIGHIVKDDWFYPSKDFGSDDE